MQLSVILVNYNYSRYVGQAAEAILRQDYPNVELMIIDDASTDDSVDKIFQVLQKYKNKDIQFLRHKKNQGMHFSFNEAISLLSGDCIYMAASDDLIIPGFFDKAMSAFKKYPEIGLCSSKLIFFKDREEPLTRKKTTSQKVQIYNPAECIKLFRDHNFWLAGTATIYNMNLVRTYGGTKTELHHLCDWYLHHQIALNYPICFITEELAAMRQHGSSLSAIANRSQKTREKTFQVLLDLLKKDASVNKWKKSHLLYILGKPFGKFLLKNPKYWHFLPHLIKKKLKKV